MRAPRFHCPTPLASGTDHPLDPEAAKHAARVLRLRVGAPLTLFDGRGGEHEATLVAVDGARVVARVGAHRAIEREPPFPIVLAQALVKGERMDLVVQKAVELGATALQPLATLRCEVKLDAERAAKRLAHWRGVVRAACEQCGRNRLPEVRAPLALAELAAATTQGACWVLAPDGAAPLVAQPMPRGGVTLVVGPEGGLAPEELALLARAGALPVALGPRVLRTETAGLAALAAMQARWGDFGGG